MRNILLLTFILAAFPLSALISLIVRSQTMKIMFTVLSAAISSVSVCLLLISGKKAGRTLIEISKPLIDINWLIVFFVLAILVCLVYASLKSSSIPGMIILLLQLFAYAAFRMFNPQTPGPITFRLDYFSIIPAAAGLLPVIYAVIRGKFVNMQAVSGLAWSLYIISISDKFIWIYFSTLIVAGCMYLLYNPETTACKKRINKQLIFCGLLAAALYLLHYAFSINAFADFNHGKLPLSLARAALIPVILFEVYILSGIFRGFGKTNIQTKK